MDITTRILRPQYKVGSHRGYVKRSFSSDRGRRGHQKAGLRSKGVSIAFPDGVPFALKNAAVRA